ARAASPSVCSAFVSFLVPAAAPSAIATATNSIQTTVAVFQCIALHRPARAARFTLIRASLLARKPSELRLPASCSHANGGTRRLCTPGSTRMRTHAESDGATRPVGLTREGRAELDLPRLRSGALARATPAIVGPGTAGAG